MPFRHDRQFGWEKLEARGKVIILGRRHRDWYQGLAGRAEQELTGKHQGIWLDRLEADSSLGVGAQSQGDYEQAFARFEEGLPLLREVGEKQWTAMFSSV